MISSLCSGCSCPKTGCPFDGRLRENLDRVPPGRLLSLLGVKYIITDKVNDVWINNIFYDLQFEARLGPDGQTSITAEKLTPFPSTSVGVVSYLEGATRLADGTPVAAGDDDRRQRLGRESRVCGLERRPARGVYPDISSGEIAHSRAQVGHTWQRGDPSFVGDRRGYPGGG